MHPEGPTPDDRHASVWPWPLPTPVERMMGVEEAEIHEERRVREETCAMDGN